MDLERFLEKCVDGQWKVDQLDWSGTPTPMSREKEIRIVQYFTDMAAIELLAGALFAAQRDLVADPTLKRIFSTFVVDEERHSKAAERLARYYDVHHYQEYLVNQALLDFRPHYLDMLKWVSPEVANHYVTGGELLLDIALLRSINDYVGDPMSDRVMDKINRDESRHIAMDYFMMEYYASEEYQRSYVPPKRSARERARAIQAFVVTVYYSGPFLRRCFIDPSKITDPESKRLREAFKRMQLLSFKPALAKRPFSQFLSRTRQLHNTPVIGWILGDLTPRLFLGVPKDMMRDLFTADEARRTASMSVEEMAQEALAAKDRIAS